MMFIDKNVENDIVMVGKIEVPEHRLKNIVTKNMLEIGMVASLVGFNCFRETLLLVIAEDSVSQLVTEKYVKVAEKLGVSVGAVERSIRTLIATSYVRSYGFKKLSDYFGGNLIGKYCPTNAQMLSFMNEYVSMSIYEAEYKDSIFMGRK